jgi:uncharacterized protein
LIQDFTEIAFSPAVKSMQERLGVRTANEELAKRQKTRGMNKITPALKTYLSQCKSLYMASASLAGQPYIQHRGGPEGFLHVLDDTHIAFADFPGNKQYISLGNLSENPQVLLFLMNYAERQRIKIWGTAYIIERGEDEILVEKLSPPASSLYPLRAIKVEIQAWDINCPAHIPELYPAHHIAAAMDKLQARIAELEYELSRLKKQP